MTGLVRTAGKVIPYESTFGLSKKLRDVHFSPRLPKENPVVPLPDEDAIDVARRRRRSRRQGSRASTVLTGGEPDPVGDSAA